MSTPPPPPPVSPQSKNSSPVYYGLLISTLLSLVGTGYGVYSTTNDPTLTGGVVLVCCILLPVLSFLVAYFGYIYTSI